MAGFAGSFAGGHAPHAANGQFANFLAARIASVSFTHEIE